MRRLLCRLPERPFGVLHQQNWWQPDLCRAVRKVVWQGRACHCPQGAGLLQLSAGCLDVGLLLWCLVRQAGGVRGPLQARGAESAIATCFATASPDAAGSPFFARSPPSAATSGSGSFVAAPAAQSALGPISIGRQPGCRSHCRDCHWGRPGCRHRRCHHRQVYGSSSSPAPAPSPPSLPDAALTHALACLRLTGW